MLTLLITAVLSALAGGLIIWLITRSQAGVEISRLKGELANSLNTVQILKDSHSREIASLKESHNRFDTERETQIESLKREAQQRLLLEKEEKDRQLARQREEAEKRIAEADKQWALRFEKVKEELLNVNSELLAARQEKLQSTNRSQISELLEPIRQQFDAFKKSVDENRTAGQLSKEELKQSFDTTMKLFAQQQELTIEAIRRQTDKIGEDAENLVRVLRRDSKAQGDWGEMILESLLESSGLERDVHFFIQENVKDGDGKNFRPDVIVRFPEGRSVIIDSKVSLTAYTDAFEAEDEPSRRIKLKEHARSVKRHIDELAVKKYDTLISDAIGLVLMFIPNDQCYLSAIEQDKDLSRYAYSKGIVIISPSNLMIALQLAFNMWQQDRQTKNVESIVKTATELYEKVAVFSDTFQDLETHITRLNDSFGKAKNQMFSGKGNLFRRIENLKDLGITPKKSIKGLE